MKQSVSRGQEFVALLTAPLVAEDLGLSAHRGND